MFSFVQTYHFISLYTYWRISLIVADLFVDLVKSQLCRSFKSLWRCLTTPASVFNKFQTYQSYSVVCICHEIKLPLYTQYHITKNSFRTHDIGRSDLMHPVLYELIRLLQQRFCSSIYSRSQIWHYYNIISIRQFYRSRQSLWKKNFYDANSCYLAKLGYDMYVITHNKDIS